MVTYLYYRGELITNNKALEMAVLLGKMDAHNIPLSKNDQIICDQEIYEIAIVRYGHDERGLIRSVHFNNKHKIPNYHG